MSTLTTTATVAAFFSSTAFIVTASLLAAALIAYLIYALVTGESKPAAPKVLEKDPTSGVSSHELGNKDGLHQSPVPEVDPEAPEVDPEAKARLGDGLEVKPTGPEA